MLCRVPSLFLRHLELSLKNLYLELLRLRFKDRIRIILESLISQVPLVDVQPVQRVVVSARSRAVNCFVIPVIFVFVGVTEVKIVEPRRPLEQIILKVSERRLPLVLIK